MVLSLMSVVVVLLLGSTVASIMQENISGNARFSLAFSSIFLVTVVGAGLFVLWGWTASLALLGVYWAWCLLGGLANRAHSRAMTETAPPQENACPRCGSEVRSYVSGGSVARECVSGCGWGSAVTDPNQAVFDPQLYDVFPVIARQDRKATTARLAVALGMPALDVARIVEHKEPIAKGVQAVEVQRIARLLAPKGIAIVVRPEFPWRLTEDA
jgi:hypothetical protein